MNVTCDYIRVECHIRESLLLESDQVRYPADGRNNNVLDNQARSTCSLFRKRDLSRQMSSLFFTLYKDK